MTAFDALFRQMNLSEGETVLIHAVGSGVGTAAVQLTQSAGVRAIGTSRTKEKVERALELGLDVGILADESWPERVMEASGGSGVDVILDLVGGAYLEGNLRVLADGGRQIVVGVPSGPKGQIDLRLLMGKRALIKGTVLRARPLEEKISLAREFEHRVCPLFAARRVVPIVDSTFSPEEARRGTPGHGGESELREAPSSLGLIRAAPRAGTGVRPLVRAPIPAHLASLMVD